MTFIVHGKTKEAVSEKLNEVMKGIEAQGKYDEHRSLIQCGDSGWKGISTPVFHKDRYNKK